MTPTPYGDGTRVLLAGQPAAVAGEPFLPGPVFAAPYHLGPDATGTRYYARNDNPTWSAYEAALEALEGGPAVVFPSGMAAVSAVLWSVLRPGDRVVVPSDGYYQVRSTLAADLPWLEVTEVPTPEITALARAGDLPPAALVLLESPSNPRLDVCDLAVVSAAVHAAGGLVAVDNTLATPLAQRPLDFGVDFSVASDTKAMSGHSDLLLGHVACREATMADRLRGFRTRSGVVPGPFEVWLAHRSLGTLDVRLRRQADNAAALVERLRGHRAVSSLRYPWLAGDPSYDLAARQMLRPVGVISFELADADAVARLLAASRLLAAATSFGGLHTTVDRRAQFGDRVPPGFVRVSCGCEDAVDLVADLGAALDSVAVVG